ncbi:adenylyltransferase/cytidyltransferase family protein [Candidatus Peregrinibacteria bacterium]|nr:adenylyltransferase/cytidyltransferase family protein [Candidatus Peregrinibacteria bacterium]
MKILVFGTFDRLHPGHRFFLDHASSRGVLHVVIARDLNVERIKGRKPMQTEAMRKKKIEEAYPHATVVLGDPKDFLVPVRTIQPDLILLGYDQKLPPGVSEEDLPPIERVDAFEPEKYKSSLRRTRMTKKTNDPPSSRIRGTTDGQAKDKE